MHIRIGTVTDDATLTVIHEENKYCEASVEELKLLGKEQFHAC